MTTLDEAPAETPGLFHPDIERRFWSHVVRRTKDECWEWTLACTPKGYGRPRVLGRNYMAHRLAWAFHHRQLPPVDRMVLHHCDNPPCCNPAHLRLGTHIDNMHDRKARGRYAGSARHLPIRRGEEVALAKLTDQQVIHVRKRYATGDYRYIDLATEYGVSITAIWSIVREKTWRHLL
jgi:hypothetical protein